MTLGLWGPFFTSQIRRSSGGYLWIFVSPLFYKQLVSILVKTNFGWFFKTRIDIHWFYIWFNIHLISEYQKLEEPKVLGTFGGEQSIKPQHAKNQWWRKLGGFSKLLVGLLNTKFNSSFFLCLGCILQWRLIVLCIFILGQ
jgi:hypothetical protein